MKRNAVHTFDIKKKKKTGRPFLKNVTFVQETAKFCSKQTIEVTFNKVMTEIKFPKVLI